jgi:hypothetical protein
VPIAARIGLINTMVFTHLPSNILLILIPFAPDLAAAIGLLLARSACRKWMCRRGPLM